ncbi:conserved hypothetical protein [Culex quinquefasciatus]|uniref:Uncharacterized protein n=1 Tax=Culex quinquefasciatus TaxID=7176 RepID=B0VZQ3_CULQU|nr:conserved hypothetical protein [Culex quinquefasciatus]|eukprot:XP_001841937.1 conserved hypothetical protein [Culex quinquefasciatus]
MFDAVPRVSIELAFLLMEAHNPARSRATIKSNNASRNQRKKSHNGSNNTNNIIINNTTLRSRPSRSRQREPVPGPERARTPCINRDTVLRINRRPVRHRSCDSFWPPQQQHGTARSPSPRGTNTNLGGAEGGSFAYDIGAYGHYGSHESVYFDERVRKQHKIEPLRTMFDKANVVLVDWGGRNKTAVASTTPPPAPTKRLSYNGLYDRRCQEKVVGDDDAGNNSVKQGEMIESEAKPPTPPVPDVAPPRPPSPPPRRYFLPMEQLQSGVGIEILLRCYGAPTSSLNQSESQEISTSKIDDGTDSRQRAKQQQQPRPPPPPGFPAFTEDRTLYQDGIQSKPPLKSRATPTKRFPSKPPTPTPTIFPVNHSDDPSPMTTANRDDDSFEDEPSSTATATNDDPVLTVIRSPVDNYDNKSIKSNYCANDAHGLRRSESRDSARSWRVDEVLEFPPPPPYLCDCDDNSPPSSGRCSAEQGLLSRGDYRLFRNPTITAPDPPRSFPLVTIRQYPGAVVRTQPLMFVLVSVAAGTIITPGDKSKHRQLNCSSPDSDHQPGQASNSLHKSIDAFLAHEQRGQAGSKNSVPGATADQTTQQMSFTDGEYVFGPYDEHSEEFQHFNLWSSEFRQLRRNCRHQQRTHRQIEGGGGGAGSDSSSGTTLVPPQATSHDGSSCSCSVISSSDTLREDLSENELAKTPEWRQPSKQVENYDDDKDRPENAAGNVPPAATSYHRWVRFENGNIHPPSTPLTRVPTPYPSPTRDDEDEAIFDRFAEQLKGSRSQDQDESVGPVENVPLIDAVLDDLLTFSKSLTAADGEKGPDDDNAASGATGANEDSSKETTTGKKDSAGLEKSLPSKPLLGSANSDDVVDGEKCDQNANEAQTRWDMSSEDNYLKREDIFANVAIFNWNPLDVYQHHGLFMIDPRFALADLHATTVCNADDDQTRRKTDDAHSGNGGDDTDATDGADPSSANVNSFATQRARQDGILLLESHKIPNDNRPSTGTTVDHFYDSAHVEYPVRWPDLSLSNATKECHQSPPPTPLPLVESDYDNDLAKKCNPQKDDDGEEGTARGRVVEWCGSVFVK